MAFLLSSRGSTPTSRGPKSPLGYSSAGQADALCKQAAELLQRGGPAADAEAQFAEALRLDAGCARALNGMGFIAATVRGDLTQAKHLYGLAIEAEPYFSGAHHNLGELLLRAGEHQNVDRAIEELTLAVGADPDLLVAHRSLASAWLQRVDEAAGANEGTVAFHTAAECTIAAERHLRRTCEIDASDVADRVRLAKLVFRRDADEAETLLREALALSEMRRVPGARALLGRILSERRGDHDAAEPLLRAAAREESSDPSVNLSLAVFLDEVRGRHDEAHAYYTRVLHLAPTEPTALLKDGILLARHLRQPKRAEAVLRKALDLSPKSSAGHFWLGEVLESANRDYDEAEFRYRRAIACDPTNVDALVALGAVLHTVRHHLAGARTCFQRALALDADCAAAQTNLAAAEAGLHQSLAAGDNYALADIIARTGLSGESAQKQMWYVNAAPGEAAAAAGVEQTPTPAMGSSSAWGASGGFFRA